MTGHPSTPYGPGTEEEYLHALLYAINLATNSVLDRSDRPITRLEQEKLCYFAIKEFDLPVTYSWYIAGAYTQAAGDPQQAPKRMTVPGKHSQMDTGESDHVRQYRNYFESETFFDDYDLKKIWYTNRFKFLHDFYEECAPEEFKDLYLASIEIQRCLHELDERVDRDTSHKTLADFGAGSEMSLYSTADENEFRLFISDFHLELAAVDTLSQIHPVITRATDVLEQVFTRLTTLESVSTEQRGVLDRLESYFYFGIWRCPALHISSQTAHGPNRHELAGEHGTEFVRGVTDLMKERDDVRKQCQEVGLYPEVGHHSQKVDEEQAAHLHEMMREVLGGSE